MHYAHASLKDYLYATTNTEGAETTSWRHDRNHQPVVRSRGYVPASRRARHRADRSAQLSRKLGRHALSTNGFVSDSPENRASDLHELFLDPSVHLILAAIGGDHSCHLLPLLDLDIVRRNPKPLVGCSDVTVLNVAIWSASGLVTFNGPALLTDFAETPGLPEYTKTWFLKAVADTAPIGRVTPATSWTEEFIDWTTKADLQRPRALQPSTGWRGSRAAPATAS